MANELRELQLQGDSTVYKLNDARITTSAVSTATHFLATDSSISSIAPITAANLASVLGGVIPQQSGSTLSDFNNIPSKTGIYYYIVDASTQNKPFSAIAGGIMFILFALSTERMYLIMTDSGKVCFRKKWNNTWGSWMVLDAG